MSDVNAIIPGPFTLNEDDPRVILDGEGLVVATAVNPFIAEVIVDVINGLGADGLGYHDAELEAV